MLRDVRSGSARKDHAGNQRGGRGPCSAFAAAISYNL
jgi:hypothetical protein